MNSRLQAYAAVASLIVVSVAVGLIYRAALPGLILFDDLGNLRQLSHVTDWPSALDFVFSGTAGPLGRPLALATFATQAVAWPDSPAAFLRVNIAIHIAAIAAAFGLAWGLTRIRRRDPGTAAPWVALGVAALWGLSPFLATSNLMLVQRMTTLAGLFVLAGLAAFVWAHLLSPARPRLAHVFLLLGLGLGTLLATLSKENGALLPLLALVILWLWIPKERRLINRTDRSILLLFAIIPSLALLTYLGVVALPSIVEHGYPQRYFTPAERLMAQPAMLLDYLQNLLLPRGSAVTPFMDHYPAPQGWLNPAITLVAALFWPGLLAAAIWMRRAAPSLLFGLLFFLVAHLLESGFLGLELYFQHRNYIPAFGIYFALVYAAAMVPERYSRLVAAGGVTYALLFAVVLFQVTSGWSQPLVSGERWLIETPYSERAAHFLANQYLLQQGDLATAQRILDQAAERQPRAPYIQLIRTQICVAGDAKYADRLALSVERLRHAYFEPAAAIQLPYFTQADPSAPCKGQDYRALASLADALLENPPYARSPATKGALLATKGLVALQEGNYAQAIALLTESFWTNRHLDIAFFAGSAMSSAGREDELRAFLTQVREAAPTNVVQRAIWLKRLSGFRELVGASGPK